MEVFKRGVSFNPSHVYKIIRANLKKGGAPKVSEKVFDEKILNDLYVITVMKYYDLLPEKRLKEAVERKDKEIPEDIFQMSKRVREYLEYHGPFMPLAIGMMNCIIDMDTLGITDSDKYFALKDYLIEHPADSFSDYIRIITEFEKGSD